MARKTIALVAHDARRQDMVEWADYNKDKLAGFRLVSTAGTASAIENITGLTVESVGHSPDSGDTYISYEVLEGRIDRIIFFIDVRNPQGHEHDTQALIRTCVLKNIPIALNRKTADFIINSSLMEGG